jgi:hypothetical protein
MLTSREFYELSGNVDAIARVMDRLATPRAYVIFVPTVAVKLVLFAGVSEV